MRPEPVASKPLLEQPALHTFASRKALSAGPKEHADRVDGSENAANALPVRLEPETNPAKCRLSVS